MAVRGPAAFPSGAEYRLEARIVRVRLISSSSLALVFAAALLLAPSADAARPDSGLLSSRLYELSSPTLRDASRADQALAVSLPASGSGSLQRSGDGIVVEVRTSGATNSRVDGLRDAGAEILNVAPRYDVVTASADERELRELAASPGVQSVEEVLAPMIGSVDDDSGPALGAINPCATGVLSEGDAQLNAGVARTQFDVDGSGIEVGVLSDSYDTKTTATTHAANDIASADLPGAGNPCGRTQAVEVFEEPPAAQGDEGRAMLQIVHDIAPGASLSFVTALGSEAFMATGIRTLADTGADVIVDDVIYYSEPMFQDGVIANAIHYAALFQDVTYFSMAFNANIISGTNNVGSFEAPAFRQVETCPEGLPSYAEQCMDFNPADGEDATYGISVPSGETVKLGLQWAQPLGGVATDLDAYLVGTGLAEAPKSENTNVITQRPFEFVSYQNTTGVDQDIGLVINRYTGDEGGNGASPRLKLVFGQNGGQTVVPTEYTTSAGGDIVGPAIFGHNGTADAQTVAAVPYNNSSTPEVFSSRGPVTHYFAAVSGPGAAAALATPEVLNKPDVAATDGGITSFFGTGNRFFGTSAAAPHAAAVAALQLSANRTLTLAQVKQAQRATARPVGAFGQLAVGSGLIDAQAAINSAPPPAPVVAFTAGPSGPTASPVPSFTFTVSANPKTVQCSIDGGAPQACSGSFAAAPLADGPHTAAVTATDYFNQPGTATQTFAVDTTGPAPPTIVRSPPKKSRSPKAHFTFFADDGARFECRLGRGAEFVPCTSPARYKKLKGDRKHTFRVRAADALGNIGGATAYRWHIR